MTCQCTSERQRTTYTVNPMTKQELFLCSLHAKMHREGHGFPVWTYEEMLHA